MESKEKIGDIYDEQTTEDYYEAVGRELKGENEEENILQSLIPENLHGKNVLDLCCGNGRHSEIFCERGADQVVGVDLSESMLAQAKIRKENNNLKQLDLVCADLENLPTGKDKFDLIFCRFGLMYSSTLEETLKCISDSLSDGGEALIEINIASLDKKETKKEQKKPIPLILSIEEKKVNLQNYLYTLEEYTSAFEKAGLEVDFIKQTPANDLSVDPNYPEKDIDLSYGILKLKKIKTNNK